MTKTNTVLFFDTEYTSWEGSISRNWSEPNEFKEIVQIGAVVSRNDLIISRNNSSYGKYLHDLIHFGS